MNTGSSMRRARVERLGVAAFFAVASHVFAAPYLPASPADPSSAFRPTDEQPLELHATTVEFKAPQAAVEGAENRPHEPASARYVVPEPRPSPVPTPRRDAPPSEIELHLKQLIRQLGHLIAETTGVPGVAREQVSGGEVYFLGLGAATAREPLPNATQLGGSTSAASGHEEFTFTPIGGRRAYSADLPQPTYDDNYTAATSNHEYSSARAVMASAQWAPPPVGSSSAEHLAPFVESMREALTDPVTIMVAFGWLCLWLFLESVRWGPSRRRRQQLAR